jgi:hypothetical protein
MSLDAFAQAGVALLSVLAAGLQVARVREGGRAGIRHDLEILTRLDPESAAARVLAAHVETRVLALVRAEEEMRRDWNGIVASVLLLSIGVLVAVVAAVGEGPWRWVLVWLAAVFVISAAVRAAASVPRRFRDAKGNVVDAPDEDPFVP